MSNLEFFIQAYIECALWASTGEPDDGENNGDPLDQDFNILDVTDSARKQVESECNDFLKRKDVSSVAEKWGREEYKRAGHDFFLTRNHHGGGFWDGDWPDSDAVLTKASHEAGSSQPYVGDDGGIYFSWHSDFGG